MRGVGLVLVDERRRRVLVLVDVVGGAQDAVRAGAAVVARVSTMKLVGEPGTKSGSSGCSGTKTCRCRPWSQVEAVVEELAEEREPGVERRRQAGVRRHVRDEEDLLSSAVPKRRRGRALDQAGRHPRGRRHSPAAPPKSMPSAAASRIRRIDWRSGRRSGWRWCGAASRTRSRWSAYRMSACRPPGNPAGTVRIAEYRIEQARETVSAAPKSVWSKPPAGAGCYRCRRPCAGRRPDGCSGSILKGRAGGVRFGDLDLLQNEIEIGADEHRALAAAGRFGPAWPASSAAAAARRRPGRSAPRTPAPSRHAHPRRSPLTRSCSPSTSGNARKTVPLALSKARSPPGSKMMSSNTPEPGTNSACQV